MEKLFILVLRTCTGKSLHRLNFEDEFISALILQIKTIYKQMKIEEINELILQIEEDKPSKKKGNDKIYQIS